MKDWHNQADEALFALRENHESVTYQCMLDYFAAAYEKEKENMVLSSDPATIQEHWIRAKGYRELLDSFRVE